MCLIKRNYIIKIIKVQNYSFQTGRFDFVSKNSFSIGPNS